MTEATHIGELLSGYLDAALPPAERERVESHLEACAACRAELEALRVLQIELGAATPPEPPSGYWERFAARVEKNLPQPEPAGPGALAARIAAWLLPSGRLAWTRALGAVATITIVTYVALHGFRHEEVGIQPRETLGSSPDAARPPARPNASATAPPERSQEGKTPQAVQRPSRSFETRSGPAIPVPAPTTTGPPSDAAGAKRELEKSAGAALQQDRLSARETGEAERHDAPADEKKVQATEGTSAAPALKAAPAAPGGAMNTLAAPRGAVASPQTAPQSLQAGRRIESDLAQPAAPATSVENTDVLHFVQAALAGDTGGAHGAWEAFQKVGNATDAEHMRSWLGRVEPAAAGRELRERSVAPMLSMSSTDPAVAQLLDLDALVWPRRGDPSFGAAVSDLAGRFEAHAVAGAEPRARAIAYLEWLAAQAPDAASRDLLHARVEKLRD